MSYLQFFGSLATVYLLYYLLLFTYDSKAAAKNIVASSDPELVFEEDEPPEKVLLEDVRVSKAGNAAPIENPIVAHGGVNLRELFILARNDAIEYTRSVSF